MLTIVAEYLGKSWSYILCTWKIYVVISIDLGQLCGLRLSSMVINVAYLLLSSYYWVFRGVGFG